MDLISYIIGKKSGGGGGSTDRDWNAIGYSSEPSYIQEGYDYALEIKNNWNSPVSMNSFFRNDYKLIYMPLVPINPSATDMASTFADTSLEAIALLDTSNVTNMGSMFSNSNIKTVPLFNTSNVTNMSYMFNDCHSLEEVPLFNTSNVTNMASMFSACRSLKSIPQLDTSNVTTASSMFSNCNKLETVPLLDFGKVSNINGLFMSNAELKNLGGFKDLGKAYSTSATAGSSSYNIDLQRATNLTHESLMNIINNVYDIASLGVAEQKIKMGATNLAKLTAEEIAIATNKGWNVTQS